MKTTGVKDVPKKILLVFLGHPNLYTWRCPFLLRFDLDKWDLTQNIYALLSRSGICRKYALFWSPFLLKFDSDKWDLTQTWLRHLSKKMAGKASVFDNVRCLIGQVFSRSWCKEPKGAPRNQSSLSQHGKSSSYWPPWHFPRRSHLERSALALCISKIELEFESSQTK